MNQSANVRNKTSIIYYCSELYAQSEWKLLAKHIDWKIISQIEEKIRGVKSYRLDIIWP